MDMQGNITAPQCPFSNPYTWHPSFSSDVTRIVSIANIVIISIAMPVTILSNGFLIFLVLKKPSIRTKERVMVVFYLIIPDFCTGLVSYPLFIAKEASHLGSTAPDCYVDDTFCLAIALFTGTSFLHIALVALDRHIAINHALHYKRLITITRLTRISIAVWMITIVYNGIYFILVQLPSPSFANVYVILDFQYYVGCPVVFLVVVYWYVRIFHTLHKIRHRKIQDNKRFGGCRVTMKNRREVFTNLIQAFGFLVPYTLCTTTFVATIVLGPEVRTPLFFTILSTSEALLLLNSLLNPFVFCFRTAEFNKGRRKALNLLITWWNGEMTQPSIEERIEMQEIRHIPNKDQIQIPRLNTAHDHNCENSNEDNN